jgi:hypothetical protein
MRSRLGRMDGPPNAAYFLTLGRNLMVRQTAPQQPAASSHASSRWVGPGVIPTMTSRLTPQFSFHLMAALTASPEQIGL